MGTTTIRIDEKTKARVSAAAKRAGTTTHALMLEAILEKVEREELAAQFHQVGDERWAKLLASGKAVSWEDAKTYLKARAQGERTRRPAPRKLAR